MTIKDDGKNWVVIGPSHMELGLQVPTKVDNWSLTLCTHACTHTHTHTFHKAISVNQVHAHSWL